MLNPHRGLVRALLSGPLAAVTLFVAAARSAELKYGSVTGFVSDEGISDTNFSVFTYAGLLHSSC